MELTVDGYFNHLVVSKLVICLNLTVSPPLIRILQLVLEDRGCSDGLHIQVFFQHPHAVAPAVGKIESLSQGLKIFVAKFFIYNTGE